jgi:hypothetical protein
VRQGRVRPARLAVLAHMHRQTLKSEGARRAPEEGNSDG